MATALALLLTGTWACPAQCDCTTWSIPCEMCSAGEKATSYDCLSKGRDGGKEACLEVAVVGQNASCAWAEEQGSNWWSGGSNACVVDRSACCEDSDASTTACYQLGRPTASAGNSIYTSSALTLLAATLGAQLTA